MVIIFIRVSFYPDKSKTSQSILISVVVIALLLVPAITRSWLSGQVQKWRVPNQPPYIRDSGFIQDIHGYRGIAKTFSDQKDYGRISIIPGTNNVAALAGLKIFPVYSPSYNSGMEKRLCSDGLINCSNIQPYWIELMTIQSRVLAIYGVRFVISLDGRGVESDDIGWNGWIDRKDLYFSAHRVFENRYYLGRAYLVTSSGKMQSGVKFLQDKPESIVLEVNSNTDGHVVLADLYYPGWQAFVDDEPVPTEAWHECLRSVALSKGKHVVRWEYTCGLHRLGMALSALMLLFLACFIYILTLNNKPNHL